MPMTFYAHQMGFIERDYFCNKYAVNFEAVSKETVEMFVTGGLPAQMSQETIGFIEGSQYFEDTWSSFTQYGPESEDFQYFIPRYLSEVTHIQIILLFEDYWAACQVLEAEADWWGIEIDFDSSDPKSSVSALCSLSFEENMDGEFDVLNYWKLSAEENKVLYDLYVGDTEGFQDNKNAGVCETDRIPLGAITPTTVIGKVQVLYVGAGLSCRLVDYVGNVVGYFDMGQELPLSAGRLTRFSPAAPVLHQIKRQNINIMALDAAMGRALTVIISHWHYDHVRVLGMLARECLQNNNYATFWTNLTLICPAMVRWRGWSVTDYNSIRAVMNLLNPAGLQTVPNVMVAQTQTINLGNNNITLYKADIGGPGVPQAVSHNPHNHGLAAAVRLGGMGGNVAFLTGDCSYDTLNGVAGVLDRGGLGYEYLVATHHGGTYTHNQQSNPAVIPTPDVQVASNLIYSANGVAYGHPDPAVRAEYANRNWNNSVLLHQFCQAGQFVGYELI